MPGVWPKDGLAISEIAPLVPPISSAMPWQLMVPPRLTGLAFRLGDGLQVREPGGK
jgi:hypothetical protein